MRTLVFGASGYIGAHLVPRLVGAGHEVRATARNGAVFEGRDWDGVELVSADALEAQTLVEALAGIDVAYYLVHSMAAGRDFARLDRVAADNFREAAERSGVQRIIYLGGLQPSGARSEHLASRHETGERLRAGTIPVTELRAGIIVGPGSAAFEVIRDLVYHLPVMTTPRWVRSRTQPIALDDLLRYLVGALDAPATMGRIFDVGGPEVLSYEQMLRQFAAVVSRRVLILPLPVLTPRLSSYWLDLVTAVPARVARPLVDGLTHDLLADDEEIRSLVPQQLHTYREAAVAALDIERSAAPLARWTEGALSFRRHRPDIAFYSKRIEAQAAVEAPAAALWREVTSLGGDRGWLYANWLWHLRGLLDRLVGGVGMRRGRRDAQGLRVGDPVDFWRVVALTPGERITIMAEMRLPGSAVLEFQIQPEGPDHSRLVIIARYHPAGVLGLLYWYALAPVHGPLFRGLTRALAAGAEASLDRPRNDPAD